MPSKPKYDALHARQVRERYIRQQRELKSQRTMQLVPVTVVDAFSGDADGLLPITALTGNLAIKVEDWRPLTPPPGFVEELHLEWRAGDSTAYSNLWSESFQTSTSIAFPLNRFIEQKHFIGREGLFHFRYGVKGWNSASSSIRRISRLPLTGLRLTDLTIPPLLKTPAQSTTRFLTPIKACS